MAELCTPCGAKKFMTNPQCLDYCLFVGFNRYFAKETLKSRASPISPNELADASP
jgi:hypothetical protein